MSRLRIETLTYIESGSNGTTALQPADIKALKERSSQTSGDAQVSAGLSRAAVYENTATDRLKVITGNIGVESHHVSSFTGISTVHHNTMGADASIITGDVSGQAALEMIKLMWK